MKTFRPQFALVLSALGLYAISGATVGCSADANDKLTGHDDVAQSPDSLASEGNTHNHTAEMGTGDNDSTEPVVQKVLEGTIGSPEVVARLHGCTKMTIGELSSLLSSRGVTVPAITAKPPTGAQTTAGGILSQGQSALGVANYSGRVAEALFASTSAFAKQFDVLIAAAPEIQANFAKSTACGGATLVENNQLTKDGISCLMGKPAKDEHITLANAAIAQSGDPATGLNIAVAAILAAAHTCE